MIPVGVFCRLALSGRVMGWPKRVSEAEDWCCSARAHIAEIKSLVVLVWSCCIAPGMLRISRGMLSADAVIMMLRVCKKMLLRAYTSAAHSRHTEDPEVGHRLLSK